MVRSVNCSVISRSAEGPQQRETRRQIRAEKWAEKWASRKRYRLREYQSEQDREAKEYRSVSVFAVEIVVVVAEDREGMIVGNFERASRYWLRGKRV